MKKVVISMCIVALAMTVYFFIEGRKGNPGSDINTIQSVHAKLLKSNSLTFISNQGQWDEAIAFVARRSGEAIYLQDRAITVQRQVTQGQQVKGCVLKLSFMGALETVVIRGDDQQAARFNYFLGKDRSTWRSGVNGYAKVVYQGLYLGIDLQVREQNGLLEYDLLCAPGADLSDVVICCDGIEGLEIDDNGYLVMTTALGEVKQEPPRTWCVLESGEKMPVECAFRKLDDHSYGFAVTERDMDLALVIDPGLEWSTFIGGNDYETALHSELNASGNVIVTGCTESLDFPVTTGAYDTTYNGGTNDGYVSCITADGSHLLWSTYLGGSDIDMFYSLALDDSNRVTIGGLTKSPDFPVTPAAFDTAYNDSFDAVVARLNSDGTQMIYATYIGGTNQEWIWAIDINANSEAVVGGYTESNDFPTTPGAYDTTYYSLRDAFITKLNADGSDLVFSTYLGGSNYEGFGYGYPIPENYYSMGMTLDDSNNVVVTGMTGSANFPTTTGAYDQTFNGGSDAFVTCLAAGGDRLLYSTFLGGTSWDDGNKVSLDQTGNVSLGGMTYSNNFPTTPGAFDSTNAGQNEGFLARMSPALDSLIYSTLVGGNSYDCVFSITIDAAGNFLATGLTTGQFPITHRAYDTTFNGGQDAFICRLAPSGNGQADLLYSSYLGSTTYEWGDDIQLVNDSVAIVVGYTQSTNFPVLNGFDMTYNGGGDGFVCRFGTYVGVEETKVEKPQAGIMLGTPCPSMTRGVFKFTVTLASSANLTASIYDLTGQRVDVLFANRRFLAGIHDLTWGAADKHLAAGVYYLQLDADGIQQTKKFVMVK